ncbi:hypothetical protein, partial [Bacillus pumilus]|uniref:hypothetical protein n=1 Tax=Bacillus pumilus TaxID=1408 RepID=UPI002FFF2558
TGFFQNLLKINFLSYYLVHSIYRKAFFKIYHIVSIGQEVSISLKNKLSKNYKFLLIFSPPIHIL